MPCAGLLLFKLVNLGHNKHEKLQEIVNIFKTVTNFSEFYFYFFFFFNYIIARKVQVGGKIILEPECL